MKKIKTKAYLLLISTVTLFLVSCGHSGKTDTNNADNPNKTQKILPPQKGSNWTVPDIGMEFVWIKQLNIWVGKYEVTNEEYRKFKPKHDSKEYKGNSLGEDRLPVVRVSFKDAQEYAKWLTKREREAGRVPAGYQYRLPTKKEWFAFCQCGDNREYPWGNNYPPKSGNAGNYSDESATRKNKLEGYKDGFDATCPVEKSWANAWSLYGVGGNVSEFTRKSVNDSSLDAWRGGSGATTKRAASILPPARSSTTLHFHHPFFSVASTSGFVLCCPHEGPT